MSGIEARNTGTTNSDYVLVNVFTEDVQDPKGGNPLAVFPNADGLTDGHMQAIARKLNLSETAFVFPPADPRHSARVRIFTPKTELPFAGHPNVGTGFVLARRGMQGAQGSDHLVFEEAAGLVRVWPEREDGIVRGAAIAAPHSLQIGIEIATDLVCACTGLQPAMLREDSHNPLTASVGTWFIFAEVTDLAALAQAEPQLDAFREAAAAHPDLSCKICLYVRKNGDATNLRLRVFAPLVGTVEDAATGSAAAALAALLTAQAPGQDVDLHYAMEQGVELGRPSRIRAQARKTAEGPVTARVAGSCVEIGAESFGGL